MVAAAARKHRKGRGLGLVVVNLQQTPYDAQTTLRIFAKVDEVMELLAVELGIDGLVKPMDHVEAPQAAPGSEVDEDVFLVPFDAETGLPSAEWVEKSVWDLRPRRKVRLTGGPYEGDIGTMLSKDEHGHYRVVFRDSVHPQFRDGPHAIKCKPFKLRLGRWFVEEATNGHGNCPGGPIPFVNVLDAEGNVKVEPEKVKEVAAPVVIVRGEKG